MPEERGSIYKSTANEIGEALKAKLGGEGFAPKDWSESLNLLGIASEDTEAAINSLKESEGSGERGSILLSTANAIGTMLNKKYNSQRGFSPAEWASATRKMKALETDTKSGGIVNLKGAKEVPITSLVGIINPTLEGTDTLTATRNGKNILLPNDTELSPIVVNGITRTYTVNAQTFSLVGTNTKTDANWLIFNGSDLIADGIKKGKTYTFYHNLGDSLYSQITYYDTNGTLKALVNLPGSAGKNNTKTFTVPNDFDRLRNFQIGVYSTATDINENAVFMLEVGSSATAYTPFVAPTTYTANLGRTIYGGSADIVKGEGREVCGKITYNGTENWNVYSSGNGYAIGLPTMERGTWYSSDLSLSYPLPKVSNNDNFGVRIGVNNDGIYVVQANTIEGVTDLASFKAYLSENPLTIIYPLATPTDFTFGPIPINTSGDTENFYTSNGDTSITYYEEPTPYTRGLASGMIASIPEANTEFPFTKLKSTIAPSVDGKDTVEVYNYGKNLFNKEEPNVVNGYINTTGTKFTSGDNWRTLFLPVVSGATYTVSRTPGHSFRVATSQVPPTNNALYISTIANHTGTSITVTIDSNAKYLWVFFWASSNDPDITPEEIIPTIQIEAGSEATTFEEYKQPTTYTAELGETVYGGSVDFVSGEVIGNERKTVLDNSGWTYYPVSGANTFNKIIPLAKVGGSGILDGYDFQNVQHISQQPDKTFFFYAAGTNARISIRDDSYTNASDFAAAINNKVLLFELATPTEASIEPQEIYPREGVNNIWNDANGITEVGYFGD